MAVTRVNLCRIDIYKKSLSRIHNTNRGFLVK